MSQNIKKQETKLISGNSGETFAQFIERVRVEGCYSFSELASILFLPKITVWKWCKGKYAPDDSLQKEVRKRLSRPLPPSKSVQAEMKRLHYLTWEPRKNRWRLRVTIERGAKYVGFRKTYNFPKLNAEEAILAKDSVIRALESVGLKIHGREKK